MPQLPAQLRLTSSFPFAGRARELEILRGLLKAREDGVRIALVGGEAGSGKSRLVREFAREAAGGALVAYGACDPVVRRPYGPVSEVLDHLVRHVDGETLRDALGGVGGELARILPDLPRRVSGLTPPLTADPDTERHRLHSAFAALMTEASRRFPLVVVLEDGHWADIPTLLLLRQLPHAAAGARALVITTFRDTEAEVPDALSAALVDLRRSESVVRLRLGGLSADEISQFVRSAGGRRVGVDSARAAEHLHDLTGGNAFLITELWRTLLDSELVPGTDAGGDLDAVLAGIGSPEGVREVVGQRLARVDAAATSLLELASVIGAEFDLSVIGASAPVDEALTAALGQAIAHGMIEEVPSRRLAFRFTHELVRRALYDRLPALRRARLHLEVGETLEAVYRGGELGGLAELAHHFSAAAAIDGPRRALRYAMLAGRAALSALDFDEAATRFEAALALGIDDPRERAETQLELGTACFRAGRSREALTAFRAAARIARELRDPELLSAAAIGLEDACWRPAMLDEGAVELLQEALAELDDRDSELRVKLLAGLTRAHAFTGDYEACWAVERAAVAMARRLGDRLGLATVLLRSYWSRATTSLSETLDMLDEAIALTEELGERDLQAEAMEWRIAALIALGAHPAARRELAEVHALAEHMHQPFPLHVAEHYASALALCAGDLAGAEAAARRSREWSRLLTGRPPTGIYGIQMFGIRREQGRLDELVPVVRVLARTEAGARAWRPGLAALLAELGMEAEARAELVQVRREDLDQLRSSLWVASLAYLADACWLLDGDAEMAGLVYDALSPRAGGIVVVGHGVACYGAVDRYLGMLATTLRDHERAIAHYERALSLNERMGAPTWVAHTLYAHARTLRLRGEADDPPHAAELLARAVHLAEQIGMSRLVSRARPLLLSEPSIAEPPDELTWREVDILRLVAGGRSNREIGDELSISGHTVANHVRSILRKTGAANRTEAAGYAYRNALVERTQQG